MRTEKLFFILSLIGILTIIIISQNSSEYLTGKITSIDYSNNKITISLENNSDKIIIFTSKILNLYNNDNVILHGRKEKYLGEIQIVVDKIIKIQD